jgi:hypothetical protein
LEASCSPGSGCCRSPGRPWQSGLPASSPSEQPGCGNWSVRAQPCKPASPGRPLIFEHSEDWPEGDQLVVIPPEIAALVWPRAARSPARFACSGVAPWAAAFRVASVRFSSTCSFRKRRSLLQKDMSRWLPGPPLDKHEPVEPTSPRSTNAAGADVS